jgi:hypothetical protein
LGIYLVEKMVWNWVGWMVWRLDDSKVEGMVPEMVGKWVVWWVAWMEL